MICYVQLYLMVMIIRINGLVKKASANTLPSGTRDEILTMIQDWIQRNKVPQGERVYHLNMDTHGNGAFDTKGTSNGGKESVWSNRVKLKDDKANSPNRSKRKWIKFKQPKRFPGYRYYGSFNRITPELLDPFLINHDNQLQWSDLIGNNNNLFANGLPYLPSADQPIGHQLFHGKLFDDYRSLLGQNYHLTKGHHEPHHPDKQEHKHDHNHNHNHEHKHHYHVTKTKTKHIHHVTVPIPYPVHIKVQKHHKHHHHDHKSNQKDIKPWLLIAAIGLPLLLGALLLPLALLFLTTLVTLFAALAGGGGAGGIFGNGGFGGATLIPITTTTTGGRHRRSTELKIYDSQSLDALYILIMEGIYSMASNLQNDHYPA
ncbi:uncharacterized protein LOC112539511 [Tetranychus urticae]|uniref:uncharacterized protein LOC112539511 n=1 Tax=Tetranychus urticae TaxID=32264 RepID=UPI000D64A30A|nr:uncharacterized protein LOC112539511 [Tetranychus urticae]